MALFGPAGEVISSELRTCRGCGCDDLHACPGGCAWALLDIDEPTGVCTTCAEQLQWQMGLLATVGVDPAAFERTLSALEREAA